LLTAAWEGIPSEVLIAFFLENFSTAVERPDTNTPRHLQPVRGGRRDGKGTKRDRDRRGPKRTIDCAGAQAMVYTLMHTSVHKLNHV
jgi:hypothetical protein